MSIGAKIVKPGSNVQTHNPGQITLDTEQPGSMKIHKIIKFLNSNPTLTYRSVFNVPTGKFIFAHNLGYSPAFIAFRHATDGSFTELLPTLGVVGALQEVISDPVNIVVDGIPNDSTSYTVLVIFKETLDV